MQTGLLRIDALQVVASIKGYAEAEPTSLAAAATHHASGGAAAEMPPGPASTAEASGGTGLAAAAALMTSPRYGLHTARSRLTAGRTEVAMLGPGDIAGECCNLGCRVTVDWGQLSRVPSIVCGTTFIKQSSQASGASQQH